MIETNQINESEQEKILYGIKELKKLKKYRQTDTLTSIWQLITTFIPLFGLWYLAYLSLNVSYALTLAITLLNTGFAARTFIIQHDCGHGSFLKSRKIQNMIGCFCSFFTLIPYHYWRKVHAIHHADLSNLDKRSPGELPTWTVNEYLNSSPKEQWKYRLFRNPLIILFVIPPILFFIDFRTPRTSSEFSKKEQYSVYITDLAMIFVYGSLMAIFGWKEFLMVQLPLSFLLSSIAMFLFYVQHQYENTFWTHQSDLDFFEAALKGSSYLKLPGVFNWFTGDVGYHHIHHLAPMIPNYMLEKCHQENPELHQVTTLTFLESFKCLNYALWDEEQHKLISFKALENTLSSNQSTIQSAQ